MGTRAFGSRCGNDVITRSRDVTFITREKFAFRNAGDDGDVLKINLEQLL